MIQLSNDDLFASGAQAITNTINCVGVMGKGIALEFKRRYPVMFEAYRAECEHGNIRIGEMWIWTLPDLFGEERYIINFPTKKHWKDPSKLEWISLGLDDLRQHAIMMSLKSLALPALGCTNGGLSFPDVMELVETKLGDLETEVTLYRPK